MLHSGGFFQTTLNEYLAIAGIIFFSLRTILVKDTQWIRV